MTYKSPLRDLANKIRVAANTHASYSQVATLMMFVDDYINLLAYVEETHKGANDGQISQGNPQCSDQG
jgi:hypothetical protein